MTETRYRNNIAVNILDPGPLKSESSSIIPWARHDWDQHIQSEEVGPSVLALAPQDTSFTTGQLIRIQGFGKTWGL